VIRFDFDGDEFDRRLAGLDADRRVDGLAQVVRVDGRFGHFVGVHLDAVQVLVECQALVGLPTTDRRGDVGDDAPNCLGLLVEASGVDVRPATPVDAALGAGQGVPGLLREEGAKGESMVSDDVSAVKGPGARRPARLDGPRRAGP